MKLLISILFSVLSLTTSAQKKVAVWETKCTDNSISPFQSTMVRGGMETAVGNASGYEVYDRSAFDAIMKEQKFQRSGAVSDSEIKRMGEMAGVQYIIVPEATASGGEFYILVKMLDVETGKFGAVYEELCGPSGMEIKKACSQLGTRLFGGTSVSGSYGTSHSQSGIDNISTSLSPTGGNIQRGMEWRIGYVNSQDIILLMPEYSKAKAEIQNFCNQHEYELRSMQEDLQKKNDAFDKEKASLSGSVRAHREQELIYLYQRMQQYYQDNQQALDQFQQEKMQAIQSMVKEAIKEYGIKNNLLYVFDSESGVIINKEVNIDLTENVKYRLGIRNTDVNVSHSKISNKIGFFRADEILSLMNITDNTDAATKQNVHSRIVKAIEIVISKYNLSLAFDNTSGIPFINDSFVCDITTIVENELNLTNITPTIPNKFINNAKFAHVNSTEIISAMPEYTQAQTDIQNLQRQYEEELQKMQDELKVKNDEIVYQHMQQYYQTFQEKLQKVQTERMQAIQTKILAAIKVVGQEGGYAIVMDTTSGIPYLSTTLSTDVTAHVKKKLGIIQ